MHTTATMLVSEEQILFVWLFGFGPLLSSPKRSACTLDIVDIRYLIYKLFSQHASLTVSFEAQSVFNFDNDLVFLFVVGTFDVSEKPSLPAPRSGASPTP